jgi:mannose-1-phosphate guanylyltransferase/mannose-6-phosphate isomerase
MTVSPSQSVSLIALILSGGGGTRLWPVSTDAKPKQFLRLFGDYSLFQETLARTRASGMDHAVIVANASHEALITDEISALGVAGNFQILLEPMRRDSAPAIAAGVAAILQTHGREAIVVALPCDHLIPDHAHFGRDIAKAARIAAQGRLVTFGI